MMKYQSSILMASHVAGIALGKFWALSSKKVLKVLSPSYSKRRMGAHMHISFFSL